MIRFSLFFVVDFQIAFTYVLIPLTQKAHTKLKRIQKYGIALQTKVKINEKNMLLDNVLLM